LPIIIQETAFYRLINKRYYMKTTFSFILLLTVAATSLKAQYNKQNLKLEPVSSSEKYKFEKLVLYPIRANKTFEQHHRNVGRYGTLKEALQRKKVVITEHASGEVNTLYIENVSSDTVMVLAGEVVQGGKQDRMIAQDFILHPKSGKKDVSVFCVEHGRWQAGSTGKAFTQYYSISSNEVRKAGTVKKNQQEVWNKVSENTSKNKAGSSTGTLAALKESEEFTRQLKKYTDHFGKLLVQEGDVIGMVAVSGEVVLGCDMFATHALFQEHYTNLINSYATEAITSGKEVTVSYEKVKVYLDSIIDDESRQEKEVEKKGTMLKDGNRKLHITTF
jgi:hypothetical protein